MNIFRQGHSIIFLLVYMCILAVCIEGNRRQWIIFLGVLWTCLLITGGFEYSWSGTPCWTLSPSPVDSFIKMSQSCHRRWVPISQSFSTAAGAHLILLTLKPSFQEWPGSNGILHYTLPNNYSHLSPAIRIHFYKQL